MAFVVEKSRSSFLVLRHVEQRPNGSFQYRRRIPEDIQSAYGGKAFFVRSLKRDPSRVSVLSARLTESLDREWRQLRRFRNSPDAQNPAHTINPHDDAEAELSSSPILNTDSHQDRTLAAVSTLTSTLKLSEALSLYLEFHPNGSSEKFIADNTRAIAAVIERIGDLPIDIYTRQSAEAYRDELLKHQASGTVRRRLRMICAIFNRARTEKQLGILNPFQHLGIVGEGEDEERRIPFDARELRIISTACHQMDDDIRHVVALQMDTGCRVAEIVGLRAEDVVLTHIVPHIRIKPWGKVRTLKTAASERDIPLVGEALWAAGRGLEARRKAKEPGSWLFPRYASDKEIKATHASNALNKWLRSLEAVQGGKTTHCFRHAMRDRLRAVQVPHDIQEAIGGWGSRTIGQGYGNGYPLMVLAEHMRKIV